VPYGKWLKTWGFIDDPEANFGIIVYLKGYNINLLTTLQKHAKLYGCLGDLQIPLDTGTLVVTQSLIVDHLCSFWGWLYEDEEVCSGTAGALSGSHSTSASP
jgi:hypothetical protein